MNHILGIDFFDGPNIDGVVRSEELVSRSFTPTVETPLVVAHKILTSEHRVLLDPNNRLAEIEAKLLEYRRIVAAVGVTAPNVESPAGPKHPGQIAEPGTQQGVEFRIRDEVVGQRPVLGTQLLTCRFGFLRVPRQVK